MTNSSYRVLFVEDDEKHFVITRDLFALLFSMANVSRFDLEWVATFDAALEAMVRNEHDAYLLDYRLGERNGLELLRAAIARGCHAPIIMLTGYGNHDLDVEAMKAGAADYLVKGQLTADLLERSIRYAIERKRSAEALRVSQEYARNIIDSSLDMIIAVDTDRRIIEFNRAAQNTFGYRSEEVLGKHVDILYANPGQGLKISEAVFEKQGCVEEVINVRKNGDLFPSFLAASVLRDAQGKQVGAMGISRDITEQKKAEAEIKKLTEELERRVIERTAQLEATNLELKDQIAVRKRAEQEREVVIQQLKEALAKVKTLSGLLPICSHCKKIRDDKGYWNQLEDFIRQHSEAEFTHGICPECAREFYPQLKDRLPPAT